ncbi:MAG: hypothetical protein WCH11_00670 [Bdellovibrio sp.]
MGEVLFFVKSFLISIAVILFLQIQNSQGITLEERAEDWIRTSQMGTKISEVAKGAALAVRHLLEDATKEFRQTLGNTESSIAQKAGRLQLDLQRNPSVQKSLDKAKELAQDSVSK